MLKNFIFFFTQAHSRSLGFAFFSMSILFGSWVSRIPEVQNKLELTEGAMSIALLAMGVGAFLITFPAGYLISKLRLAPAILCGIFGMALALLIPILAPNFYILCLGLFLFGLANSFLNIAANTGASALEKESHRTIMSTCHGMFSVGAMISAGLGSFIVGMEIPALTHFLIVVILICILGFSIFPRLKELPNSESASGSFSFPPSSLWSLAFIVFAAVLCEGVIASWSGIFLDKILSANSYMLGLGFASFSGCMAIGRLSGDELIPRIGPRKILWMSLAISIAGMALAIQAEQAWVSIVGFGLTGLGLSIVVPIVFSAAAKVEGLSASNGIAAVAGITIIGFLGGPPLIGFIAEFIGFRMAFTLVAALLGLAAWMAFIRQKSQKV